MSEENDNVDNDNKEATTDELASLIKAQAKRIGELESEATTSKGLKDEVAKLQETLGTQTSLAELVEQLKTMNASSGQPITEEQKAMTDLQKAADAGNMKAYRKLRKLRKSA